MSVILEIFRFSREFFGLEVYYLITYQTFFLSLNGKKKEFAVALL